METERTCKNCGEIFPLSEFASWTDYKHKTKNGTEKRRAVCKSCYREAQRERYNEYHDYKQGEKNPFDPHRALAAGILKQAVIDFKNKKYKDKEFWRSFWFQDLCALVELEPDLITRKLGITT